MHKFISMLLCFFITFQSVQANEGDPIPMLQEASTADDVATIIVMEDSTPKKIPSKNSCFNFRAGCAFASLIACITTGVILLNSDSKSSPEIKPNSQINPTTSAQSTDGPNTPPIPSSKMVMKELLDLLNITAS